MKKMILFAAVVLAATTIFTGCGLIKPVAPSETDTAVTPTHTSALPTATPTADPTTAPDPTVEPTVDPTSAATTADSTTEPDPTVVPQPTDGRKTVLLDAGHGFIDGGATSKYLDEGIYEKDINLDFVMDIKAALESKGITVLLTHDGKTYMHESEIGAKCKQYGISYDPYHSQWYEDGRNFRAYERAIYAKVADYEYGVDLFVSFHADSFPEYESTRGSVIYYCTETDRTAETVRAVTAVENELKKAFPDRRVRSEGFGWDDGYAITKYPTSPSMLIEIGYISNRTDAGQLTDPEWRARFAGTMANAISAYLG